MIATNSIYNKTYVKSSSIQTAKYRKDSYFLNPINHKKEQKNIASKEKPRNMMRKIEKTQVAEEEKEEGWLRCGPCGRGR